MAERAQKLEGQIPAARRCRADGAPSECRARCARRHRRRRRGCPAGSGADADLWRRHRAPDRAEADAVSGARHGPGRDAGADDAGKLHPAAGRACAGPCTADAAFDELPMPAQAEIRQARGEVEDENPQKTRLSLLQRLANVGLGRRDEESEPPVAARTAGPAMPPLPALPERKPQRTVRSRSPPANRYRSMPAVPRRRVWTSMAARHLLRRRHRATTILISRPSCGGRRPEDCYNKATKKAPAEAAGAFSFGPAGPDCVIKQLILNH